MNILIVDDDDIARISLSNILHGAGAHVTQAVDGQDAWEQLACGLRVDAVCCDMMMPRLDGIGLLKRTRGHIVLKDLPFVFISSAANPRTVDVATASGAAGYILKPFLAVQTRVTMQRVVRDRRAACAEHFLGTTRRLAVTPERLEERLRELATRANNEVGSIFAHPGGVYPPAMLCHLHAGSRTLGLWRAAACLKAAMEPTATMMERLLAVAEVGHLVDDQIAEMHVLAQACAA
ncbi:MAG: response regulator [Ramlibacter sp.]|nr:response regulator [Ramlibacter sp.]